MRKAGVCILVLALVIVCIPVLILGGIGPGIELSGIITKISVPEKNSGEKTLAESQKIKVHIKSENKIVEMDFEDYIAGVLAAEMPAKFDLEALKAQAVTARTYAASKMPEFGGKGCVHYPGSDICNEIHCQAWVSKVDRLKTWKASEANENWNKIISAVSETKGQIVSYEDKLATGVKYFSTSDGRTENSLYAFGYSAPYLISVESPNEEEAPNFKSTVVMSKEDFINRIKKSDPKSKITTKNLASQIKILSWTEGGRVNEIKIGDKTFSGVDMRWAMGLRSADFGILVDSKNVKFNVRGNGHGVGLSQWGANEMGKRGYKYDQIVTHYFKGTRILTLNQISMNKLSRK